MKYHRAMKTLTCFLLTCLSAWSADQWTEELGTVHTVNPDSYVAIGTNAAQAKLQVTSVTNYDFQAFLLENLSDDEYSSTYLTLRSHDQYGFVQQFPSNYENPTLAGRLDIQQGDAGVQLDAYTPTSTIQFLAGGQHWWNIQAWVSNGLANFYCPLRLDNGYGYTEFTVAPAVASTNRIIFSLGTDTVAAGQYLKIHSTTIADGVNSIVITNSP